MTTPARSRLDIKRLVFAVVTVRKTSKTVHSVCGTGFMLPGGIFVTCWHCVSTAPPAGDIYMAARAKGDGGFEALALFDLAQDSNGADIALGRLPDWYQPHDFFGLGGDITEGGDVGSYGFPLPETLVDPGVSHPSFEAPSRTLRGYITRAFHYNRPGWGETRSYELDMPTPEGLSGAPLLVGPEASVIGIVYGSHSAYTIEESASVHPETKAVTPEVRKLYTFGLALDLATLEAASGAATGHEPLGVYVRKHMIENPGGRSS